MFQIKKAVREAMPILACFWGPSFSGKTRSALEFARGLVGDDGKICLIDTENKRALIHAEEIGGWDHLDFQPPFTPKRYIEAYNAAQKQGPYDAIIIDSGSHVWEGEGGVIDMSERDPGKGIGKWKAPKMEYKRMVNHLLRSPTHVIFCLRSKESISQTGRGSDMEIKKTGMVPICEKTFIFEMTVSFLIGPDHKPLEKNTEHFFCNPTIPIVKLPISDVIKPGEMVSQATGQAIGKWVSGGVKWDKELAALQQAARDLASAGMEVFEKYWKSITKKQQKALEPIYAEMKALATQADEDIQRAAQEEVDQNERQSTAETTASLNDDIPLEETTEEPVDEKPEDTEKAPTEDKKAKESADKEPDEKPAEETEDPPTPEEFIILDKMGGTIKCESIDDWRGKLIAGIGKLKTKESITALNKRHQTIFDKMEDSYLPSVEEVRTAIEGALKNIPDEAPDNL